MFWKWSKQAGEASKASQVGDCEKQKKRQQQQLGQQQELQLKLQGQLVEPEKRVQA